MRIGLLLPLLAFASAAGAATAVDRGYSVQDFDRIQVEGPYDVQVRVGPAAAAHAHGPQSGIDRLQVLVNDGTLIVRTDHSNGWGGYPGAASDGKVTVFVTTPRLRGVALAGTGDVDVDRIRNGDVQLGLNGSGDITVGTLEADSVGIALSGSGDVKVAGRAKQGRANLSGSGDLDARALSVQDADISVAGSGDLKLDASRSAKVTSAGSGDVVVTGSAACTVHRVGSGDVTCGKGG
ncbi:MAG: DUF2807 domain-containing protein [Sphingomonadaceae bacterium]|nr:DUF2807 domain-containing protein [Sphingomonadaceae bacterium]